MAFVLGGHRGFGCTDHDIYKTRKNINTIPTENTLTSITKAFEHGASYVEIDAIASADGIAFLTHTSSPHDHFFEDEKPTVNLSKLTYAEIQNYKVGKYVKDSTPTLEDALTLIKEKSPKNLEWWVNIELKGVMGTGENYDAVPLKTAVKQAIKNANFPEDKILFSSFSFALILDASHIFPKSKFGMLFAEKDCTSILYKNVPNTYKYKHLSFTKENIDKIEKTWQIQTKAKLNYYHPESETVTHSLIEYTHTLGKGLNVWNYLEEQEKIDIKKYKNIQKKCAELGTPLTIITDYLDDMQK